MTKKLLIIFIFFSSIAGYAQIPSGYYDTATGTGYTLKTQLKTIIDNIDDSNGQSFHDITVTYGQLWILYETSDVRSDGKVWDVYSNCNFTFGTDQDTGSGGTTECDKFNREHTFPQSWFGGSSSHPMRADAFHVLPSDKKVNGIRGNLSFGEVSSANYTSQNGSKRGTSSITGPTGDVFEPADEFKGDIARGLFYVATRYQDEIGSWETNNAGADNMLDGSNDKVFESWALQMLYDWHINDPVSQKEIDRNNAIFTHQNNRNPFIDHPEYINSIWSSVLSTTSYSLIEKTSIYPNPTTYNYIYVKNDVDIKVEVYNVLGKKLLQRTITTSNSKLDISSLSEGIYLMKISKDGNTTTRKFIKR